MASPIYKPKNINEDTPANFVEDDNLSELPKPEDVTKSNDLEIEVLDDNAQEQEVPAEQEKPERKNVAKPNDNLEGEIKDYSEKAQKRINELTYRYREEQRHREAASKQSEEAVRFAEAVAKENQALKQALERHTEVVGKQLDEKNTSLLDQAKKAFKTAYDNGDAEAMIAAQEQISAIYAERMTRPQPAAQPIQQQPQQYVQQQPQQRNPNLVVPDEKATGWLRENPWFQSPGYEDMTGFALGLHEKLIRQGYNPSIHDEYYDKINSTLHAAFPDYFAGDDGQNGSEKPGSTATPRKAAPVAQPTRGGKAPRKVQLTPTQVTLAKRLGLTVEQYAAQVAKEMANG